MEKIINIFTNVLWIIIGIVAGFVLVCTVMYFTGNLAVHHIVMIPGVFEKYEICLYGHDVYSWFVGNVTYIS